jgi:TPP-dependent trihydroxycyclohexane-1,2-dione (THcHDO) dehydratase
MAETIRLTMAQALVRALAAQKTEYRGVIHS